MGHNGAISVTVKSSVGKSRELILCVGQRRLQVMMLRKSRREDAMALAGRLSIRDPLLYRHCRSPRLEHHGISFSAK